MTPRPTVSPNHSPTIAPARLREMPTLRPVMIVGRAEGNENFQKICQLEEPKLFSNWIRRPSAS